VERAQKTTSVSLFRAKFYANITHRFDFELTSTSAISNHAVGSFHDTALKTDDDETTAAGFSFPDGLFTQCSSRKDFLAAHSRLEFRQGVDGRFDMPVWGLGRALCCEYRYLLY
jgi:hypothetical protein